MDLWIAFTLGLFGSLHCAGMCGPLVLALPRGASGGGTFVLGRIAYNAGRLLTYMLIGGLFGLAGQTMVLAGAQRWLSIGLGVMLLIGWFMSRTARLSMPIILLTRKLTSTMRPWMSRSGMSGLAVLGSLNGLLPCGLVYVAAAGAAATGSAVLGAGYMGAFGLGTVPMLLGIALSRSFLPPALRLRLVKAIPLTVIVLATLLILRGMSLGIPYLSPELAQPGGCCH